MLVIIVGEWIFVDESDNTKTSDTFDLQEVEYSVPFAIKIHAEWTLKYSSHM